MSKNTPIKGLTYDPITRRVSTPRLNSTQKLALVLGAMLQAATNIINIAQGGKLTAHPPEHSAAFVLQVVFLHAGKMQASGTVRFRCGFSLPSNRTTKICFP